MTKRAERSGGLPMALGAYVSWGLLPLYIHLLDGVPAVEIVVWRILFTIPVCLALIAVTRHGAQLRAAFRNRRALLMLMASAALIGANWLVYTAAVNDGHVLAASIGYYINPLVNVLLATLFLRERLSRWQWIAVGLAAAGVAPLAWAARDALWISLALASSFSLYGLVRKLAPVDPLSGLTVESLLLMLPAAGVIGVQAQSGSMSFGSDLDTSLLLACAGVVTTVPLLLFSGAARRLTYSTLGFIQFITPTIVFFLGLFVFREPLHPAQLASFVIIWIALAVFCGDMLRRHAGARGSVKAAEAAA